MSNIFVTSDHHFYHHREDGGSIIRYENRPFIDNEDMSDYMIKKWNSVVGKSDKIFHLGDFSWGTKEMNIKILSQLNGIKHLILGNHDRSNSIKWHQDCGWYFVSRWPIIYEEFYIMSHEPVYLNEFFPYANLHGHLHSKKMEYKGYFNVCVELHDYTPINFDEIKKFYQG
jgi:calcineurin-like phosphoesterase family protein